MRRNAPFSVRVVRYTCVNTPYSDRTLSPHPNSKSDRTLSLQPNSKSDRPLSLQPKSDRAFFWYTFIMEKCVRL
ncbi:hypothetical protein [Coleofasciculus sp. E2-BRE-01]|uniref:hypothetical protein n=1 Tax=Coleofasciculus sp. E2-BRE-01 TaxID=3069524 RepID=UPI0032FC8F74